MMKSPLMHMVMLVTWAITALASVYIGLTAFGIDVSSYAMFQNATFIMIAQYVIGISGVISLLMFVMWGLGGKCSECGCSPCTCSTNGHRGHNHK